MGLGLQWMCSSLTPTVCTWLIACLILPAGFSVRRKKVEELSMEICYAESQIDFHLKMDLVPFSFFCFNKICFRKRDLFDWSGF
ncbi:hypothetical protein GDO86_011025 [Hymenochirus boettgeri]|uniref:Uncharacterized protein n=1 Tax=Hymenochirus boettgeri TaxID=247094 RepID=A0A8T2JEY8_9PIPI|nr:hypothetical protein GDO86_011025 [Hymenochirus boettgeri]